MEDNETFDVVLPWPFFPPKSTSTIMSHFDEMVFDVSESSHLYNFVDAIAGEAGAGDLKKQYLISRLAKSSEGTDFLDLDNLFGSLFGIKRLEEEAYEFNPHKDLLTDEEWDEVTLKDSHYRARALGVMEALQKGGTSEGFRRMVMAITGSSADIYESWQYEGMNVGRQLHGVAAPVIGNQFTNRRFANTIQKNRNPVPSNRWEYRDNNGALGLNRKSYGDYAVAISREAVGESGGTPIPEEKWLLSDWVGTRSNQRMYFSWRTRRNNAHSSLEISPFVRVSRPNGSNERDIFVTEMTENEPLKSIFEDGQVWMLKRGFIELGENETRMRVGVHRNASQTLAGGDGIYIANPVLRPWTEVYPPHPGRSATNEIIVRPHVGYLTEKQDWILRKHLNRIKPSESIVTVDPQGVSVHKPVVYRHVGADNSYFEIFKEVVNVPDLSKFPRPEYLADEIYKGELWLQQGNKIVPKTAHNKTQQYSYFHKLSANAGDGQISRIRYQFQDGRHRDETVRGDQVVNYPGMAAFVSSGVQTIWGTWQSFPKADSPDNYPGGKNGRTPMTSPALTHNGSEYKFAYDSQQQFMDSYMPQLEELGAEVRGNNFRIPVERDVSSAVTHIANMALPKVYPATSDAVSSGWYDGRMDINQVNSITS